MKPEELVHWLDGFLSANPDLTELNAEQTKRLKDKLGTVFNKVTPTLTTFPAKTYCGTNPYGMNPDNLKFSEDLQKLLSEKPQITGIMIC